MSVGELEVDMSVCLRCTVDTRSMSDIHELFSSEFRFERGRWTLLFFKYETVYGLGLRKCSGGWYPNPLDVSVHVESSDESGRIANVLSMTRRFTDEFEEEDRWYDIWKKEEEEILRDVFEYRQNGILKLLVVLKLVEDSTSPLFSPAISVQTTRYVPCLESLSEDFSKLLMAQGPNPDIEFQCGGQSTKAHGLVVSARSQVIANMLATDMVEGRTRVVEIPNLRPDVFGKFLRYLYTGKLDGLTFEVALNLFEAGDQYAVAGLAKRCSEYLVEHLSLQNACEVLVIADAHSDEDLVEKVVDYMVDERMPVASEDWLAFCDEHPRLANRVLNRGWANAVEMRANASSAAN